MSIKAIFPAGVVALTVHGLHQWDYGQTLEITHPDLPAVVEVHFAPVGVGDAIVRVVSAAAGVAEAPIPDELLEQSRHILAWVYVVGETSGETLLTVTMPLQARARPTTAGPVPAPIVDKYTEALAVINAAVADFRAGNIAIKRTEEADHATTADSAGHATTATSATKATQDGNGSNIVETYVKKGLGLLPVTNFSNFSGTPNWVHVFRLSFNITGTRYQFTTLGVVPEDNSVSTIFMGMADKDTSTYLVEIAVSGKSMAVYAFGVDNTSTWDLQGEAEARGLIVEYCPLFELPVG